MAHPLHPLSFEEFVHRAKEEHGVVEKKLDATFEGPRDEFAATWLERTVNGETYQLPTPEFDYDESIGPDMMEHLCRRLGLDPVDFGYPPLFDGIYVDAPDDGSTWGELKRPTH